MRAILTVWALVFMLGLASCVALVGFLAIKILALLVRLFLEYVT